MHKVKFFPLGNADCCRIDTEVGKKRVFGFLLPGARRQIQDQWTD
jgi:hypothetical protein